MKDEFEGWEPRVIVVDEPEYTASIQTYDPGNGHKMTFAHLDVFYMGPDVFKRLRRQFKLFREHVPVVLYCMGNEDSSKYERFLSYFGFKYLKEVACTDGRTRRLYWCP